METPAGRRGCPETSSTTQAPVARAAVAVDAQQSARIAAVRVGDVGGDNCSRSG